MAGYDHPGSIQTRVGSCLRMIEENIEQTDPAGLWNFVQLLETYVSPYLEKHRDLAKQLEGLVDPATLREDAAFHNMMTRIRICLKCLHRDNLYGYHTAPTGDSSALYDEEAEVTA